MTGYKRFLNLCNERGISPSAAMINAGLSKALATKWKSNENVTPNGATLSKLSKYFNVSADYFFGDEQNTYGNYNEYPDVVRLSRAMMNMTDAQRKEVIHYAEFICGSAFDGK